MTEDDKKSDTQGLLDLDQESYQEPSRACYKTFMNRQKKCPTCKGTGKIYQGKFHWLKIK